MSTIRLIIVHGVSTLRVKCCVSEISVHKISTKRGFFVSHRIYCLVTTSILMFYGKLDSNSATCMGPIVSNPGARSIICMLRPVTTWYGMTDM